MAMMLWVINIWVLIRSLDAFFFFLPLDAAKSHTLGL